MSFRLIGLDPDRFQHLFGKSEAELAAAGVTRLTAQEGFPCRVALENALPGESVLLIPFEHQPEPSPFRASGPIFVREARRPQANIVGRIPADMQTSLFSVRAYDREGWMLDADVAVGSELELLFDRFFEDERVAYLHLHYARRGCFACRAERA